MLMKNCSHHLINNGCHRCQAHPAPEIKVYSPLPPHQPCIPSCMQALSHQPLTPCWLAMKPIAAPAVAAVAAAAAPPPSSAAGRCCRSVGAHSDDTADASSVANGRGCFDATSAANYSATSGYAAHTTRAAAPMRSVPPALPQALPTWYSGPQSQLAQCFIAGPRNDVHCLSFAPRRRFNYHVRAGRGHALR